MLHKIETIYPNAKITICGDFNQYLENETWCKVYDASSAETKAVAFLDTFMKHFNDSFPVISTAKSDNKNKKWITPEIKNLKQLMLFFHSNFKENPSEANRNLYYQCKLRYNNILKQTKILQNKRSITVSDNKSKAVWSIINKECGRMDQNSSDESIDIESFNHYFVNHVEQIVSACDQSEDFTTKYIIPTCNSMFLRAITATDVLKYISKLKNKKTLDIYDVSSAIIKEFATFIAKRHIINTCFEEGHFPSVYKTSKVVAIHKKGDINDPQSYRQIHIVPSISKIIEYAVLDQLITYTEKKNILNDNQYGFLQGKGTIDAVMNIVESIQQAFEDRDTYVTVCTDLSKAFDCISHNKLLRKLENYGVRGIPNNIIESFLTNRMQRVHHNNRLSQPLTSKRGVPQGSILGPFLFILYINDLVWHMAVLDQSIMTTIYADDTTFSFNMNSEGLSQIQQADTIIDHSKKWFNSNELFLNSEKTEICSFSLKANITHSHVKFLGIDLDSSLSWSFHIENLCSKLSKAVYAIRKVSQTVDTEAAVTAYYGLFHSSLSYGVLSWGNASFSQLQKVFIIQKAAVRGIVNARPVEHCKDIFKRFKIITLFGLIIFENLMYIKNNTDKHVQLSSVHNYETRGKNRLIQPRRRVNKSKILGIQLYNALPHEISNLPTSAFKRKVKHLLKDIAPYKIDDYIDHMRSNFTP
nr:unnamed protein product [Callosobruchus analis]